MTKHIMLFLLCFTIGISSNHANSFENNTALFGKKKIDFGCSETDAEIYVNGKLLGKGSMELIVPTKDCITVIVKKTGFLSEKIEFCNRKNMPKPPKSYYLELKVDDAYNASIQTDIANIDIELVCNSTSKDKAWKLINQIVLSHFDVIEMTDKETGYIRTAWSLQTFLQNSIRTRVIVKETGDNPTVFKVKLVSEQSGLPLTSVKSDQLFRDWDRVLRAYADIISELQARVK
ncbi:hypothetical protein [uncultured Psychroserpens sp.]|uniref:hypothetical protein n=1 Tax=uncultured Psychroserpens sp. TaxID=255436 RepID=UPI0026181E40|nr:hypothetical protein [uncultured Psychroserpens sp.]